MAELDVDAVADGGVLLEMEDVGLAETDAVLLIDAVGVIV